MLDPLSLGPLDEVFSWNETDNGPTLHFAATLLRREGIADLPTVVVPIDREFAMFCVQRRGVEAHRVERWGKWFLRNGAAKAPPLLFCHMEADQSHLLVDGTHRYVAAALCVLPELPAVVVPEAVWRRYLVDLPQETTQDILTGFSGIR